MEPVGLRDLVRPVLQRRSGEKRVQPVRKEENLVARVQVKFQRFVGCTLERADETAVAEALAALEEEPDRELTGAAAVAAATAALAEDAPTDPAAPSRPRTSWPSSCVACSERTSAW